jgi:hypothetical protein
MHLCDGYSREISPSSLSSVARLPSPHASTPSISVVDESTSSDRSETSTNAASGIQSSGFEDALEATGRRARAPDHRATHGVGMTSVGRSLSARPAAGLSRPASLARCLLHGPSSPCRPDDAAIRVSQRRGRHRRDGSAGGACGRRSGASQTADGTMSVRVGTCSRHQSHAPGDADEANRSPHLNVSAIRRPRGSAARRVTVAMPASVTFATFPR